MLGIGGELTCFIVWRNINDNINFAVNQWLKENSNYELVAMRTAGATTINTKSPRWLVSIARLAPDGSPIIWTCESRECEVLSRWVNTVFSNPETTIIDVQISGSGDGDIMNGAIIDCTWAILVIAKKRTFA